MLADTKEVKLMIDVNSTIMILEGALKYLETEKPIFYLSAVYVKEKIYLYYG